MTLQTLRAAVLEGIQTRIIDAVLERLAIDHKRGWRDCPCGWCRKKREATVVIGHATVSHRTTGWLSSHGERDIIREGLRVRYRQSLREEEEK